MLQHEYLINKGILKTLSIIKAFEKIRREDFLPDEVRSMFPIDAPLQIGYGQTNSQPSTVAFMLERLEAKTGDKILDVGCGSGWTTALLAEIVGESGKVYGIEIIPELADIARANVNKYDYGNQGRTKIFLTDGYQGLPEEAPFDKILVSAAAEKIPEALIKQLNAGGKMIIPLGKEYEAQDLVIITKAEDGEIKEERIPGFIFVPLVKSL